MSNSLSTPEPGALSGTCERPAADTPRIGHGDVVLVTGASGFVGSAVMRRLAGTGCTIRALVRSTSRRCNLAGHDDVRMFEGDMRDAAAVASAMRGARWLFHVAADYRLWSIDPSEILDCNERGTRTIMEAALAAGVEKIVYTSSVATLEPRRDGSPSCEHHQVPLARAIGPYKRSKVVAEALVDRMIAERDLPASIVHPSTPIGPGDIKPTPTGRIIIEAALGRIPAFVETGLNLVHVDDVADGHLRALERGAVGEHYILGGQDVAFGTMLAEISGLVGRRAPRLRVPLNAVYPVACVAEVVARITRREPFLCRDSLRMAGSKMYFSSRKAQEELNYRARSYHLALGDALAWYAEHSYIPDFSEPARGRKRRRFAPRSPHVPIA